MSFKMKGKNFLRILLALCLTGMPGIALTGWGETSANPNGGGSGGSQEQQHNVDFEVKMEQFLALRMTLLVMLNLMI